MKDRDLLELESALPQDEDKDDEDNLDKDNTREKSGVTGESSEAKDDNSVAEESEDNWDVSSAC